TYNGIEIGMLLLSDKTNRKPALSWTIARTRSGNIASVSLTILTFANTSGADSGCEPRRPCQWPATKATRTHTAVANAQVNPGKNFRAGAGPADRARFSRTVNCRGRSCQNSADGCGVRARFSSASNSGSFIFHAFQ